MAKAPKVTGNKPSKDSKNFKERVVDFFSGGEPTLGSGKAEEARKALKSRRKQQMKQAGVD